MARAGGTRKSLVQSTHFTSSNTQIVPSLGQIKFLLIEQWPRQGVAL
jgi:hypothetical protein